MNSVLQKLTSQSPACCCAKLKPGEVSSASKRLLNVAQPKRLHKVLKLATDMLAVQIPMEDRGRV